MKQILTLLLLTLTLFASIPPQTTYPDGTTELNTYDAMGNLLSETDKEGHTTTYEYDGADRLIKTTYPDGTATSKTYDAAGRVTSTTDQRGNTTTYEYDAVGNKIAQTDPLGNKTTYTYDAQGNLLSTTDALGQTTRYEYNALNQRIKTIYPDGSITTQSMNISGLPESKTDEAGHMTQYGYDTNATTLPKLSGVTLANGATTRYTYDAQGHKTSQTDALGHTIQWSYEPTGEISSQTLPGGERKTYTYSPKGLVVQSTDFAGKAQKFVYNRYKQLVRIEYSDGHTVTYAYTPSGRVKTLTDSLSGTITNTYDAMGRLKTRTNSQGETITYTYDEAGNITQIETPTQSISKIYDALNRLKTVTDDQGTTAYAYDAIGRQTQITYPNGVTTSYEYDSRNRVTSIEHKKSDGTILQSFAYTYDAVGNRTKVVEESGRTVEYTYNEVNQLTKETVTNDPNGNNTTTTYTYDAVGNLVSKTIDGIEISYTYNANDQLIQKGSVTYTYDSNGNLVDDGTNTYEYDDKNRLIKVITPTDTIEYSYDAQGHRIAKTTSNGTTTYLIDANTPFAQVITETKENGTQIKYTYGNDLLSDGSHTFLTDALGSTRGLVDSNEALTDSYAYTPYGELSSHEGNSENAFLFTGEQLDGETGDYYLRARYYNPTTARFLSRDTYDGKLIDPLSQNHYLYAGGNPVMYVDPSGHFFGVMASMMRTMVFAIPRMVAFAARPLATTGVRTLPRTLGKEAARSKTIGPSALSYIYTLARLYARYGDHTDDDMIPIQVYGSNNLPEHQKHIASAFWFTPSILHKKDKENNRYWLKKAMPNCTGARDEYPYAKTYEGGKNNYDRGRVSLQCVSVSESGRQGAFINAFYNLSSTPLFDGDTFIVIPMGPVSGYFDKRGNWHSFPNGR